MTRRLPPWGPPQPKSVWRSAVGAVLYYGVFIPLASPAILMDYIRKRAQEAEYDRSEHGIEQRRRAEKESVVRKQRDTDKPQALPDPRPRVLTLPVLLPLEATKPDKSSWSLWSTPKVQQQTIIQSDSLLLTRLPADIRTLIWEAVIGGHLIEVFRGHGRLLHRLQDDDVDNSDYGLPMPDFYTDPPRTNLLSLAKTCQQIYTETIEILYSRNKFSLWKNDTLSDLHATTLACRFSAIRSLTLHWQFRRGETFQRNACGELEIQVEAPWDVATWEKACQVLQGMAALKELAVVVRGPFIFKSDVLDMLQPLRRVLVAKEAFQVRVPWPSVLIRTGDEGVDRRLEDQQFPFQVIRPEEVVPDEDSGPELIAY